MIEALVALRLSHDTLSVHTFTLLKTSTLLPPILPSIFVVKDIYNIRGFKIMG